MLVMLLMLVAVISLFLACVLVVIDMVVTTVFRTDL